MGRKRKIEIEKEENRNVAELVQKLVGDRSYKEVAESAGIDPSTVSYICRGRVKPTPDVIVSLTKPEANPQGGVTREEIMIECNYQTDMFTRLMKYAEKLNFIKQKDLSDSEKVHEAMRVQREQEKRIDVCISLIMHRIIDKGYGILASKKQMGVNENKTKIDVAFDVANTGNKIKSWYFLFDGLVKKEDYEGVRYPFMILGNVLECGIIDANTKISYVIFEKQIFDLICEYRGRIPYRGEFSVVLVDLENEEIKDEVYLSHYEPEDTSNEVDLI